MTQARIFYACYAALFVAAGIAAYVVFGNPVPGTRPNPLVNTPILQTPLPPAQLDTDEAMLQLERIELTAARANLVLSETSGASDNTIPVPPPEPSVPSLGCPVDLTASAAAGAQIQLTLVAPCQADARVTVHHNGMMFADKLDLDGRWSATVPALSENAHVMVDLGRGLVRTANVQIDDLALHDRIVLQWAGKSGFQLHAREFGASYGELGHVWREAAQAGHGTLRRLGNANLFTPKLAEVYSFPKSATSAGGSVALTVEAEITTRNCGREIEAQTLELRGAAPLVARDLTLSMPNCSAIGDFLVLNNLVDSLKIASNQTK